MKNKLFPLVSLLLLVVGCSQEEFQNIGQRETTVSAVMEEFEDSRSHATDEGKFTWSKGDEISVYTTNGSFRTFKLNGEGGSATANFTGTLLGGEIVSKCAAYPNSANHKVNGNTFTFYLPAEYGDFSEEYVANTNAPMIALMGNSTDFNFKHLGGVLRFKLDNVPVGAAQFVFTAKDKDITGDFTVDLSAETPTISAREKMSANTVTIKFKPLEEVLDDMTFFVPLPIGTYNGFTIAMKKEDGTLLVDYEHESSNRLKRKSLARFPELKFADVSGSMENTSGTITLDGVDADFYKGCILSTFADSVKLKDNSFKIYTPHDECVQVFMLSDESDNLLMMSRVPVSEKENVELSVRSTTLALVTMYPLFYSMTASEYDEVVALITKSDYFAPLQAEVEKVIRSRRNIYDENNTALLNAFEALMDDLCKNIDLSDDKTETRAVYESPNIKPFYAEINGNVLTLRNQNLNPSYYGTVTHASGQVDNIVVQTRDDRGTLDIWLHRDNWDLGPKCNYTFTKSGEYQFHLSRMNAAATQDFYLRIANDLLMALGLDLPKDILSNIAIEIGEAMIKNGAGVDMSLKDWLLDISPMDFVGIAYNATLEQIEKHTTIFSFNIKDRSKSFGKILSKALTFYNVAKGLGNAAFRLKYAVTAPFEVNFNLCYYDDKVLSCLGCYIYVLGGDKQTGGKLERLPRPLTAFATMIDEEGNETASPFHKVKFEVVAGGGSVEPEMVAPNDEFEAQTYWTLGESGEQKVKAVIVDITTNTEVSESVYFTADIEDITPIAITGTSSNIQENSATVECSFSNIPNGATCGVKYSWNGGTASQVMGSGDGTRTSTLSGLKSTTTYTYCAYVEANGETYYGEEKTFTTKEPEEPELPDLSGTWTFKQRYLGAETVYPNLKLKDKGSNWARYTAGGFYGIIGFEMTVSSDLSVSIELLALDGARGSFSGKFNKDFTSVSGDSYLYVPSSASWAVSPWVEEKPWSFSR